MWALNSGSRVGSEMGKEAAVGWGGDSVSCMKLLAGAADEVRKKDPRTDKNSGVYINFQIGRQGPATKKQAHVQREGRRQGSKRRRYCRWEKTLMKS